MSEIPNLAYFENLSDSTDFNKGSLEKAYRLLALVKEMDANPRTNALMALAGRQVDLGSTPTPSPRPFAPISLNAYCPGARLAPTPIVQYST